MPESLQADAARGASGATPHTDDRPADAAPPTGLEDPIVRNLVLALLGVVAVFLLGIISALAFGFLRPAAAPRTLVERNIKVYGALVQTGSAGAETWAKYIAALIDGGRLSDARKYLDEALGSVTAGRSQLLLQQARLEFASKDFQASADAAEAARLEAEKEQAAKLAEYKAKGITEKPENALPQSWAPAVHQKGDALLKLGNLQAAADAYTLYLTKFPTDSTLLVARGQVERSLGDRAAAEKDFKAALRFIPDYADALNALKEMGVDAQ